MPHKKQFLIPVIIIGGILFLAACMPFTLTYSPTGYDQTAAMGTVQVMLTEIEVQTLVARLTEGMTPVPTGTSEQPTATVEGAAATATETLPPEEATSTGTPVIEPTLTATPTATLPLPTSSATPTQTFTSVPPTRTPTQTFTFPAPTSTSTRTSTAAAYPTATVTATTSGSTYCNWASFVKDVSVPDMTRFEAMMTFTKTWRLKNIGTCTWTTGYALVFDSGNSMSGPLSVNLPRNVAPGETVDISVPLVAPGYPQVYTGYWKLKAEDGTLFGIGSKAIGVFWVQIKVVENMGNSYVLYDDYCNATWLTNSGTVACPGSYNTTSGSITRLDNMFLEGGAERKDQPSLVAIPASGSSGFITGTFPPYHIKEGDHFHTHIGCLDNHPNCDVSFTLSYLDANGVSHNIFGPTGQTDDGYVEEMDIDLNPYKDTTVQFVLTVQNNGNSNDDYALWFLPIIWND